MKKIRVDYLGSRKLYCYNWNKDWFKLCFLFSSINVEHIKKNIIRFFLLWRCQIDQYLSYQINKKTDKKIEKLGNVSIIWTHGYCFSILLTKFLFVLLLKFVVVKKMAKREIQLWLEKISCSNYEFVTTEEVLEVVALKNKERNERK